MRAFQAIALDGHESPAPAATHHARVQQQTVPSVTQQHKSWRGDLSHNMLRLTLPLGCISFVIGVLGLASPLFIMAVYDQVIGTTNHGAFLQLLGGVILAILGAFVLRRHRQAMIGDFAARMVQQLGMTVFVRLLDMQGRSQGRDNVNHALARLQDLERLRTVFAGPIATALSDLPVICAYAIGILSLSPLIGVLLFSIITGAAFLQIGFAESQQVPLAVRQKLGLEQQAVWRQATALWPLLARSDYSASFLDAQLPSTKELAASQRDLAAIAATNQIINQIGTSVAALMTLTLGIYQIWDGNLTTGMLIAIMMLLWRTMAPMQALFAVVPQIRMFRRALAQLDLAMKATKPSSTIAGSANEEPPIPQDSEMRVERLSHRFAEMSVPALSALSFRIPAGQATALVGPNGAGKTLLLRLLAGLERPQVGHIVLGGIEVRHLSGAQVDRLISYIPPVPLHLPGKLGFVLKHAAPNCSDADFADALALAFGEDWRRQWPQGLDTDTALLSDSPQGAVLLALAEAYLRKAKVLLIDNVLEVLDPEAEFAFLNAISRLRNFSAICFVTHNRDHLAFADQAIVLQSGQIRYAGPASAIKDKIPNGLM